MANLVHSNSNDVSRIHEMAAFAIATGQRLPIVGNG